MVRKAFIRGKWRPSSTIPQVMGANRSGSAGEKENTWRKHRNERLTSSFLCAMEMETRMSRSLSSDRLFNLRTSEWKSFRRVRNVSERFYTERERERERERETNMQPIRWARHLKGPFELLMSCSGSDLCVMSHDGSSNVCMSLNCMCSARVLYSIKIMDLSLSLVH